MEKRIRVGTRQSALAIAQTKIITEQLKHLNPELEFELVGIKTKGDVLLNTKLDLIGGKGLFVNEIEHALLEDSIDMAIHSMKDMPAIMPKELVIAAVSEREDPRDVLVTRGDVTLQALKSGAIVGTSSARREVQILQLRGDLKIKQLRGNVLTRLDKLAAGEYDAIILAAAGLNRLGMGYRCSQFLEVHDVIPSIGQGILGIQTKRGGKLQSIIEKVNSPEAMLQLEAERRIMIKLDGGCSTPIAAHAQIEGDRMMIHGMLATTDYTKCVKAQIEGKKQDALRLGENLADQLIDLISR